MSTVEEAYQRGVREDHRKGEYGRAALATANSELRSELMLLKETVENLEYDLAACRHYAKEI